MESPTTHAQRRFMWIGFVVVSVSISLILVELLCWPVWLVYQRLNPDLYEPGKDSPAYAGAAWVPDFYREQSARLSRPAYAPFRLWGLAEWHGKYLNVDVTEDGPRRRTVNPSVDECKGHTQVNIWVFGGSEVFGTGVRDSETLPSYLSRAFNQSPGGRCTVVTNFGVEGYVTTQELILLTEQLKRGGRPSIVLFIDGFNDFNAGMTAVDPRSAHYGFDEIRSRIEGKARGRFDFLQKLHSVRLVGAVQGLLRRDNSARAVDSRKAGPTIDNYMGNLELVAALSRAYDFRFYCFLQPTLLYGHKPLVPFERQIVDRDGKALGRVDLKVVSLAYDEATRRTAAGSIVVDLSGVFDSTVEPVYIDEVHLGPRGNELAAQAVLKYLEVRPEGTQFPLSGTH